MRASLLSVLFLVAAAHAGTPNVVIIFVDDMGYGDLSCYGRKEWATPAIDSIAKDGVRLTDFYVAQPVCSASRAALLTGCYPNRVGIAGALGPSSKIGIAEGETTLAEIFRAQGYATHAIGKWHLGHHPQFLPTRHGFDTWLGLPYSNDMWPRHPSAKVGTFPNLPLFRDEKVIDDDVNEADQAYLTRRYTERAVEIIRSQREKPFFLYFAHTMPHVPLYGDSRFTAKTPYGAIVREIDDSVRQVLDALKEKNLERDTIVIFTSDNGPWLLFGDHAGSSGGLREGKGTVWEGGVRVPCVIRWPGTIPAGGVCREPAMTIDILPTLAGIIGAKLPAHRIDGKDVLPLWKCEPGARSPQEAYAFYFRANELQAVRSGPWKLVLPHTYTSVKGQMPGQNGKPGRAQQVKLDQPELYNLNEDLAESTDVAKTNPETVERLMKHVETFRADLGDALTKRAAGHARESGRLSQ